MSDRRIDVSFDQLFTLRTPTYQPHLGDELIRGQPAVGWRLRASATALKPIAITDFGRAAEAVETGPVRLLALDSSPIASAQMG